MSFDLARLSDAVAMLAQTRDLEEVTHIHNIAQSAEDYARAEKLGDEAERYAREIRLRAARKAGELLREMTESGQRARRAVDGASRRTGKLDVPTLADLGIPKGRSSRWQRIAQVPQEQFEKAVQEMKGEVAVAALVNAERAPSKSPVATSPQTKINGFTERQSLRGLQTAAINLESLAVALEGRDFGDWNRLWNNEEARPLFESLDENLPIVSARIKRALRDWKEHAA